MVESGGAADALHEAVWVHLDACGGAHAVRGRAVAGRQPAPWHAGVNAESQYLRQVGLDKALGLVQHIVEQAVGTLVSQASIQQFLQKRGEPLPLCLAGLRQSRNHARDAGRRPTVPDSPECLAPELLAAIVPFMRKQLFFRTPEPLPQALDLQ